MSFNIPWLILAAFILMICACEKRVVKSPQTPARVNALIPSQVPHPATPTPTRPSPTPILSPTPVKPTATPPREAPRSETLTPTPLIHATTPKTRPATPTRRRALPSPTPKSEKAIAFLPIAELNDKPNARIKENNLEELSGITPAASGESYWGHNDKGNDPELFRFDAMGKVRQKVWLEGWENEDWEAITRTPAGTLLIGDTGDNEQKRKEYRIYEVAEPGAKDKRIAGKVSYAFRYEDRQSHNGEAMFPWQGSLYLITKEEGKKDGDSPQVFRLDRLNPDRLNEARFVGRMARRGVVTDAAFSKTHHLLAVLTYSDVAFYPLEDERDLFKPPAHVIRIEKGQCEGICFNGDQLIISNEKGELWMYSISTFLK